MTGPGWNERGFTFYDPSGATALANALTRFDGGRLVVNIADMPIKCPVAPIEFAFLADWYLRERGIRARTELVLSTPLDGCFTKPVASEHLTYLLAEKEIELVTEFSVGEVDGVGEKLSSYDGREIAFDLLVTVPLHGGAGYVERSPGLGDALGFVPTDPRTLQSTVKPNIFVLGDATDLPASKAGSVAHFEGELLERNIVRFLRGDELEATFDGHTNCFIETGFHNGIAELSDRHWLVVHFMRKRYLATGNAPSIRSLGKESGVPVKELYQLFPRGPAKLAAKIGGIPKPKGCI